MLHYLMTLIVQLTSTNNDDECALLPPLLLTYRRHYFNNTDGLIFVVDSQDRDRIQRSAQEFKSIIEDPLMRHSAILVFANKQVRGWGAG